MSDTIKVVTIGDINQDILLVPLPPVNESDNPETPKKTKQECLQIRRDGGAILMENTIRDALNSHIGEIRKVLIKSDDQRREIIESFQEEFESEIYKKNKSVLLFIGVTDNNSTQWTIAGFNTQGEFQEKKIESGDAELATELNKKEDCNRKSIFELARKKFGFGNQENPEIYGYAVLNNKPLIQEHYDLEAYLKDHKALSILKLYPRSDKNDAQVYRLEKLCGRLSEPSDNTPDKINSKSHDKNKTSLLQMTKRIFEESKAPEFIVINDKAECFREIPLDEWLTLNKEQYQNTTFILAMDKPLCEGVLWDELIQRYKKQIVVIVSAFALRKAGINIHKTGSAEHLVHDFIMHADHDNVVKKLLECQHVIVQLDNNEIIHYDKSITDRISIHYCPGYLSKEYSNQKKFGVMSGNTVILTTSIVLGMASSLKNNKPPSQGIDAGIRLATVLAKKHFESGYADIDFHKNEDESIKNPYPFNRLFQEYQAKFFNKKIPLVSVRLPAVEKELQQWNRIEGLSEQLNKEKENGFEDILIKIIEYGLEAALKITTSDEKEDPVFPKVNILCPVAKFGKFEAVDRDEIDSLIDVQLLIEKYLQNENWKIPLSIAVFGPPGSGKSFTVEEVLKHIKGEKESSSLKFNIAQFTDIKDLTGAFHKAQDEALFNNVPLVFFDEFDSSYKGVPYGWLKYFLAPMQDGIFKGREGDYKVGRAIFIFAGGTSYSFDDFYVKKTDSEKKQFRDEKGPDFVSRLRGYLNIKGINSIESKRVSNSLQFRRAILLRSILTRIAPQVIDPTNKKARIDRALINALIKANHYEHGVRSMEAIVQMSLIDKDGFHVASLPTPAQLKMHTDVDDFFQDIPH